MGILTRFFGLLRVARNDRVAFFVAVVCGWFLNPFTYFVYLKGLYNASQKGFKRAFLLAFIANLGQYYWLYKPFTFVEAGWLAPLAIVALAAYMALFYGVAYKARTPLAFGLVIGLAEWLRGWLFTGFAWNPAAVIWVNYPALTWAFAIIGTYGVSAATAWAAARVRLRYLWIFVLILAVDSRLRGNVPSDSDFRVRVMNSGDENPLAPDPWKLQKYSILANGVGVEKVDLFVAPESASDYDITKIIEVLVFVQQMNNEKSRIALGTTVRGDGLRNSLAIVSAAGIEDIYDKVHLVPFGEYAPFGLFSNMVQGEFTAGSGRYAMSAGKVSVAPLICYEGIFSDSKWVGEADIIVNISNDAWFGKAGVRQHFNLSALRSYEQGIPLVRAANMGISGVALPNGFIQRFDGVGYRDYDVPLGRRFSLFRRTGNWLFVIVAVIGLVILRRRK